MMGSKCDNGLEWRDIPSRPGYQASSDGRIRSVDRVKRTSNGQTRRYRGKMLAPASSNQLGHKKVRVCGRTEYVHRLVAEAFFGPCPEGMQVAHNDGNVENNHARNLRYATPKENSADKRRHNTLLRGELHPSAKLDRSQVQAVRASLSNGVRQKDIASALGVSRTTISAISTGRSWS